MSTTYDQHIIVGVKLNLEDLKQDDGTYQLGKYKWKKTPCSFWQDNFLETPLWMNRFYNKGKSTDSIIIGMSLPVYMDYPRTTDNQENSFYNGDMTANVIALFFNKVAAEFHKLELSDLVGDMKMYFYTATYD